MRSGMMLALGFAAGLVFVVGCPFDSSPAVAWAEEGDCGQWEVSAWTQYDPASVDALPAGWHPFAAVATGDSLGSVEVFARRCVSR
ncbi:hypothetical protein [Nannocystis bainbridge]|uniref:Uncharacterized protein n=1 Tax=Nannocystis bainbridge TaxID=2995303 RepID=A0ABT5DXT7_9BACT|nr:hypothetical protein [Nannocystis bainbridge]MDC0718380.1 hypothetical protein [Nannocystis bainbridge]